MKIPIDIKIDSERIYSELGFRNGEEVPLYEKDKARHTGGVLRNRREREEELGYDH